MEVLPGRRFILQSGGIWPHPPCTWHRHSNVPADHFREGLAAQQRTPHPAPPSGPAPAAQAASPEPYSSWAAPAQCARPSLSAQHGLGGAGFQAPRLVGQGFVGPVLSFSSSLYAASPLLLALVFIPDKHLYSGPSQLSDTPTCNSSECPLGFAHVRGGLGGRCKETEQPLSEDAHQRAQRGSADGAAQTPVCSDCHLPASADSQHRGAILGIQPP